MRREVVAVFVIASLAFVSTQEHSLALIELSSDNVAGEKCRDGWCGDGCSTACTATNCINGTSMVRCSKDCSTASFCEECVSGFWGQSCEYACDAPPSCDSGASIRCRKRDGAFLQCARCKTGFAGIDCLTPVVCPPLQPPLHGSVISASCESDHQRFGSSCSFLCDEGYHLVGNDKIRCGMPGIGEKCLADVKTCPDGSTVKRILEKNCVFPVCSNATSLRIPRDYFAVRGAPLEFQGYLPIESAVSGTRDECRRRCSAHRECTMFSFGRDIFERTCRLYTGDISQKVLANALAEEGRMISYYKPASLFGSALFSESCVIGRTLRRSPSTPLRSCAFQCQSSTDCVGFQWGHDAGTPYHEDCVLFDHIVPDVQCYMGNTRYTTFIKDSLHFSLTRFQYDKPQNYEGTWQGLAPTCEKNKCVDFLQLHSKNVCSGLVGTMCIPEPIADYRCAGQLRCNSSGIFETFPSTLQTECTPVIECESQFNNCHKNAECSTAYGIRQCICEPGYYGNGTFCQEWSLCSDEHIESTSPTHRTDRQCVPIDTCTLSNGGCDQICISKVGAHHCACRIGYTLGSNGRSCNPASCSARSVLNGNPCEGVTGERCAVSCDEGFEPVGTMTCLASGSFVGDAECVPKQCAARETLHAIEKCYGRIEDVCTPKCGGGYSSRGSYICRKNGLFEGLASCKAIECPPFQPYCIFEGKATTLSCGASVCRGSTGMVCSGEASDFQCANGWKARGSVTCTPSIDADHLPEFTNTSTSTAVCEDIDECATNNGACDQMCHNTPGSYHCSCHAGFILQDDGLSCRPKPCEDSPAHPLSVTTCHGSTYDVCVAIGKPGYSCTGVDFCQSTSQWTSNTKCFSRPCSEHRLAHSMTTCSGTVGATCVPTPEPGYTCSGSLTCGTDGYFHSLNNAHCERIPCPDTKIMYTTNTCFGNQTLCVLAAKDGFTCSGSLTCSTDGKWQGNASCSVNQCNSCDIRATCSLVNGGATCQCGRGFWGDGITCQAHSAHCGEGYEEILPPSSWNDRVCQKIYTCSPQCSSNAHCVDTGRGGSCRCKTGYLLNRNNVTCDARTCPTWEIPGSKPCQGVFNTTCHVAAEQGYACSGIVNCGRDGRWYGNPSCAKVRCPTVTFPGAVKECIGSYSDHCILKCKELFRPSLASAAAVCEADGTWSGARCIPQSRVSCDEVFGEYKNACGRTISEPVVKEPECQTEGAATTTKNKLVPKTSNLENEICRASCGDYLGRGTKCIGVEAGGVSYSEAESSCRDIGARLCTIEELQGGSAFSDLDDECDLNQVWTSSTCGVSPNYVWVDLANPSAANDRTRVCKSKLASAYGRCCADVQAYPDWNECDCEGCNGLGDCDSERGRCVNTVGSYYCTCEDPLFTLGPDGKACVPNCPFPMEYIDGECALSGRKKNRFAALPPVCDELPSSLQFGIVSAIFGPDNGLCANVPFQDPYLNNVIPTVLVTAVTSEVAGAWVQRVTVSGFDVCAPAATYESVEINWIAYDRISIGGFGEEIIPIELNTKQCRRVSYGSSQALLESSPNHIHLSVTHDSESLPGVAWTENVRATTFDLCVSPSASLANPKVHVRWAAWQSPWSTDDRFVQSGLTLVTKDACQNRADRAALGTLCVCEKNNGTRCLKYGLNLEPTTSRICRHVQLNYRNDFGLPAISLTPGYGERTDHQTGRGAVAWVEAVSRSGFRLCARSLGSDISTLSVAWLAAFAWEDPMATSSPSASLTPSVSATASRSPTPSHTPDPPTPSFQWPSQSPTTSMQPSPLPMPSPSVDDCFIPTVDNIDAKLTKIATDLAESQKQKLRLTRAMSKLALDATATRLELTDKLLKVELDRRVLLREQRETERLKADTDY